MIAFDTSLIIRIATGDNLRQKKKALELLDGDTVFIAQSVILEIEWVLRSRYNFSKDEIITFLEFLISSEGIVIEEANRIHIALDYYRSGADFADAIHTASANAIKLYTFDKLFCKKAIQQKLAKNIVIVTAE